MIGEAGFRECSSLTSVRLPSGLTTLDFQAFYRCESLTDITVPGSVTDMGMTVFGYCYDLVRADVQADISELPDWTFYGCSNLTDVALPDTLTGVSEFAFYDCANLANVEYSGSSENKAQIEEDIERDLAGETRSPSISNSSNGNSTSSTTFEETEDGGVISQTITSTKTENADISSDVTVNYPTGSVEESISSAQVDITLETAEGWNEVTEELNDIVDRTDSTKVDVYVKDDTKLAGNALDSLAGKPVEVAIHNNSGSAWQMDCETMEPGAMEAEYDVSYERVKATEKQTELLNGAVGYQIKFAADVTLNAEIMIKLPIEHARQNACLYQVSRGKLQRLQSVVVDGEGYAHFYLASVDSETEYLIGINVQEEAAEAAIIPESLYEDYGVEEPIETIEYVITGRKSSWGMNINQVTWILAGVIIVCVAGVGITMFMLNKRKLKMGYVPDLDEEWDGK